MSRRLNFLYYLKNLNKNELLYKFFQAQVDSPSKNDWILTVEENFKKLQINLPIEAFEGMSKEQFKKEVKEKIQSAALEYLQEKAIGHSKMEKLTYTKILKEFDTSPV